MSNLPSLRRLYRGSCANPLSVEHIRRGLELNWYVDGDEIAVLLSAIDFLLELSELPSEVLDPVPIGFVGSDTPEEETFLGQARAKLRREAYYSLANAEDPELHVALMWGVGHCPDTSHCSLCEIAREYRETQR